jgi:hypothetical protein
MRNSDSANFYKKVFLPAFLTVHIFERAWVSHIVAASSIAKMLRNKKCDKIMLMLLT